MDWIDDPQQLLPRFLLESFGNRIPPVQGKVLVIEGGVDPETRIRNCDMVYKDFPVGKTRGTIDISNAYWDRKWGALIILPRDTLLRGERHRPYLCFVLGHELEHARIGIQDPGLHDFNSLLYPIARKLGVHCELELPLERHCDQEGSRLARRLFGRRAFRKDIDALLKETPPGLLRHAVELIPMDRYLPNQQYRVTEVIREIRSMIVSAPFWTKAQITDMIRYQPPVVRERFDSGRFLLT